MAKKQIQIKESELRDKVYNMVMETLKETATINEAVKRSVRKVLKEMAEGQGLFDQIDAQLAQLGNEDTRVSRFYSDEGYQIVIHNNNAMAPKEQIDQIMSKFGYAYYGTSGAGTLISYRPMQ